MFGLKKLLGNTSNSNNSVKVIASKNFVSSINDVYKAKENSLKEKINSRNELSDKLLLEAKQLIENSIKTNNFSKNNLKEITNKLLESIKNNSNNSESYLNLSYSLFILGDNYLSNKYLKIAEELNPNIDGIQKIKVLLTSQSKNENQKILKEETLKEQKVSLSNTVKPKINSNIRNMYSISHKKF